MANVRMAARSNRFNLVRRLTAFESRASFFRLVRIPETNRIKNQSLLEGGFVNFPISNPQAVIASGIKRRAILQFNPLLL
jgi:hypothetical protein